MFLSPFYFIKYYIKKVKNDGTQHDKAEQKNNKMFKNLQIKKGQSNNMTQHHDF